MAKNHETVAKYKAKAYDFIQTRVKKGDREKLKEAAAAAGYSVNAYTIKALNSQLISDGFQPLQELGEPDRRGVPHSR